MEAAGYVYPQWWKDKVWQRDVKTWTEEDITLWRTQTEEAEAHNVKLYQEKLARKKEFIKEASTIFRESKLVVRYLEGKAVAYKPGYDFRTTILEKYEAAKKKAVQEQRDKEATEAQKTQLNDAIAYLITAGKKIGTDFTVENAVSVANDIAYDKAVAEAVANGPVSIKFCDDCSEWDGQNNRCSCGNRRVNWEAGYNCDFRDMYVVPEPY